MTKIIKLKDNLEVEIEVDDNQAYQISEKTYFESSINDIQSLLTKVISPISDSYNELNKNICIESTKIAVGVKIGVEGNFILAKSSAGANISVEMTLRAKNKDI